MEGKFTVSFTECFNYLHVHRVFIDSIVKKIKDGYTGGPGTDASSPATYYKAMPLVYIFLTTVTIILLHTL